GRAGGRSQGGPRDVRGDGGAQRADREAQDGGLSAMWAPGGGTRGTALSNPGDPEGADLLRVLDQGRARRAVALRLAGVRLLLRYPVTHWRRKLALCSLRGLT